MPLQSIAHVLRRSSKQRNSPKHTLQKLCKQGNIRGSFKVLEHNEHVSRSLISSTSTLSDEARSISIKTFLLYNLDHIFAFSFPGNDRIKSCYKYFQNVQLKIAK